MRKLKIGWTKLLLGLSGLILFLVATGFAALFHNQTLLRERLERGVGDHIRAQLPTGYHLKTLHFQFSLLNLLRFAQAEFELELETPSFPITGRGQMNVPSGETLIAWVLGQREETSLLISTDLWLETSALSASPWLSGRLNLRLDRASWRPRNLDFSVNISRWPLSLTSKKAELVGQFDFKSSQLSGIFESEGLSLQQSMQVLTAKKLRVPFQLKDCSLEVELITSDLKTTGTNLKLKADLEGQWTVDSVCEPQRAKLNGDLKARNIEIEVGTGTTQIAVQEVTTQMTGEGVPLLHFSTTTRAHQLEILRGEDYWDPPIEKYRLLTEWKWSEGSQSEIAKLNESRIYLKHLESQRLSFRINSPDLLSHQEPRHWQMELTSSIKEIRSFLPPITLAGWMAEGSLAGKITGTHHPIQGLLLQKGSQLSLQSMSVTHQELRHQTQQGHIQLSVERPGLWHLHLDFPSIKQLNIEAQIANWRIPLRVHQKTVEIQPTPLQLLVKDLQIKMEELKGRLSWKEQLNYEFKTGLTLSPTSLKKLSQMICVSPEITPPGTLQLVYPEIQLSENALSTKGEGHLRVFDGRISIFAFEIDQLLSAQPVTYLSAAWDDLRLEKIGEFTRFGGMIGIASGHLRDVTFSGTLLNDYDFEFRLKPLPGDDRFYFSRRATQNLIQIFAQGQGLSQGPANQILKWSGTLLGDYGITYAGLRASTQRNFVILETFDPKEILKRERSHYLLFGSRIKMPLSTQTYPVILSKSGWNGFVYYFRDSLLALMNQETDGENSAVNGPSQDLKTPQKHAVPCFSPR